MHTQQTHAQGHIYACTEHIKSCGVHAHMKKGHTHGTQGTQYTQTHELMHAQDNIQWVHMGQASMYTGQTCLYRICRDTFILAHKTYIHKGHTCMTEHTRRHAHKWITHAYTDTGTHVYGTHMHKGTQMLTQTHRYTHGT